MSADHGLRIDSEDTRSAPPAGDAIFFAIAAACLQGETDYEYYVSP